MKIISYIERGKRTYTNDVLCHDAFLQMMIESESDRLSENYKFNKLRLNEMYNFTFVFDDKDAPIQASGCQIMSDNVVRVFTRYYVFNDFRTDGKNLLNKTDDFEELKYSLDLLTEFPLVIWSRDKTFTFFKRLKIGRPDIFSKWEIYPNKIELKYKNNFQFIFYTGNISYINELAPPTK